MRYFFTHLLLLVLPDIRAGQSGLHTHRLASCYTSKAFSMSGDEVCWVSSLSLTLL